MANRLRSALTMLGILIGVAAVILLIAVGAGSSAAVQNQLAGLGTNTLTVFPTGGFGGGGPGGANRTGTASRQARLTAKDVTALEDKTNAPDVAEVAPVVNANATATYEGATHDIGQGVGTTPNYFADPQPRDRERLSVQRRGRDGAPQGRRARTNRRRQPVRRGRRSPRREGQDRRVDLDGHRRARVEGNERVPGSGRHRHRAGNGGAGLAREPLWRLQPDHRPGKVTRRLGRRIGADHVDACSRRTRSPTARLPGAQPGRSPRRERSVEPGLHGAARRGRRDLAARRRHRRHEHHARDRHRADPRDRHPQGDRRARSATS